MRRFPRWPAETGLSARAGHAVDRLPAARLDGSTGQARGPAAGVAHLRAGGRCRRTAPPGHTAGDTRGDRPAVWPPRRRWPAPSPSSYGAATAPRSSLTSLSCISGRTRGSFCGRPWCSATRSVCRWSTSPGWPAVRQATIRAARRAQPAGLPGRPRQLRGPGPRRPHPRPGPHAHVGGAIDIVRRAWADETGRAPRPRPTTAPPGRRRAAARSGPATRHS
jgi:hypothetical protein